MKQIKEFIGERCWIRCENDEGRVDFYGLRDLPDDPCQAYGLRLDLRGFWILTEAWASPNLYFISKEVAASHVEYLINKTKGTKFANEDNFVLFEYGRFYLLDENGEKHDKVDEEFCIKEAKRQEQTRTIKFDGKKYKVVIKRFAPRWSFNISIYGDNTKPIYELLDEHSPTFKACLDRTKEDYIKDQMAKGIKRNARNAKRKALRDKV